MSTEYGVFDDEGCLERGLYSQEQAQLSVDEIVSQLEEDGDQLHADFIYYAEMCNCGEEFEAGCCEECDAEEEDEDE